MRLRAGRRTAVGGVLAAVLVAGWSLSATPAIATDPTTAALPSSTASSVPTPTSSPGRTSDQPKGPSPSKKSEPAGGGDKSGADAAAKRQAEAEATAQAARKAAEAAAQSAHAAAELVAASRKLAKAEADLALARKSLTDARDQLRRAREIDAAAQTDLDAAVLAEERAARELADVEARILARQAELGLLARSAYQNNGAMGELAVALEATTPDQLADRLVLLQSIGSAGNAVIAELAEARADLINARTRMSAARERAEEQRTIAAEALAAVSRKEMLAQAAERQVRSVVVARRVAYDEARRAAVKDRRRYQTFVVQSGALGSRIVEMSRQLAAGNKPPKGTGRFVRPGTGAVTSGYGPRLHPILNYVKVHTGTDFAAGDGIVYAADDGVVLFTEYNVAYGNMTVIDHGRIGGLRISTFYAHQAVAGVRAGDRVTKGQAIGVVGSTGYSTGPHVHFEVRAQGEPLDPGPFLEGAKGPSGVPASAFRD